MARAWRLTADSDVLGLSHSDPPSRDHDEALGFQLMSVRLEHFPHRRNLVVDGEGNQADDGVVRTPQHDDQLTEVLVLGDQHASLAVRKGQQFAVARLGIQRKGRRDVVALFDEECGE